MGPEPIKMERNVEWTEVRKADQQTECDCGQKQGLAVILGYLSGVAFGFVSALIMVRYGG